jgi:hypothetical protein
MTNSNSNFKFLKSDSKYSYSENKTTGWVYRKGKNESDRKFVPYSDKKNFITDGEIKSMYNNK